MSERAARLAKLRELEHQYAELDAICIADLHKVRELLDLLTHDDVTRMDLTKALGVLQETVTRVAEMKSLLKQVTVLREELGLKDGSA